MVIEYAINRFNSFHRAIFFLWDWWGEGGANSAFLATLTTIWAVLGLIPKNNAKFGISIKNWFKNIIFSIGHKYLPEKIKPKKIVGENVGNELKYRKKNSKPLSRIFLMFLIQFKSWNER